MQPSPATRYASSDVLQERLELIESQPVRLRHERGEISRLGRIGVERHVDRLGARERELDRSRPRVEAACRDELDFGGIEVAGPEERDVARLDGAAVEQHPQRHPPGVAGRRALRGVQVAVGVDPHHRQHAGPRGEPLDRADVGATAAAEDKRPLRQVGGERERLLGERGLLDHRRLRIGQAEERRLGHGFTPFTPGAWDPDEAGRELAPARVALVLGADRDRGQRAAVGTAGAQATHADSARTRRSRNTVSR